MFPWNHSGQAYLQKLYKDATLETLSVMLDQPQLLAVVVLLLVVKLQVCYAMLGHTLKQKL